MFYDRFAQLKKQLKLTDTYIAKKLGITPQAVGKYSSGKGYPSLEQLAEIAKILKTTTDYLLGVGTNSSNPNTCQKLIQLIDRTNLTYKEFANDIINVPLEELEGLDEGKLPTYSTLKKIAEHFNVPVAELAEGNPEYSNERQLLDFTLNQKSLEYIQLAFELQQKGINPNAVRALVNANMSLKLK